MGLVLVIVLAALLVGVVLVRRARQRTRTHDVDVTPATPTVDRDIWNATVIGVATGHAWLVGDLNARARAVTERARHDHTG
jgi:hypothetical protein